MNDITLLLLAFALGIVLAGARTLYCGHRATGGQRERRTPADRRGTDRRRAA